MLRLKMFDAYWCMDKERMLNKLDEGYIIIGEPEGYTGVSIIAKDNLHLMEYWTILKECGVQFAFNNLVNFIGITDNL